MTHDAKVHVQSESNEKQQVHKSPIQSQETATPILANLTQTGLQHMSPAAVVRLSSMVGNQAVARLMEQRINPQPDIQRDGDEDDETFDGPRTKPLREDTVHQRGGAGLRASPVQQRGGPGLMSAPGQRGSRVAGLSGNIGDAGNVDGQGLYGWDRPMNAADVAAVVNDLITNQSTIVQGKRILIFSGTHGTSTGNLVNTGAAGFVGEDQATANDAMSNPSLPAGTTIEVIDVNGYTTKASFTPPVTDANYIRIAAWCYSQRSYNNRGTLKSNWWPVPDHI